LSGDLAIQLPEPGNEQIEDLQDIQPGADEMVIILKAVRHPSVTNGREFAVMIPSD
jgi:hypothetical protein